MCYRALSLGLLALAVSASAARADIIELTSGTRISGTLSRSGDRVTIKSDDGKTITVKPADIAKVTLTTTITPAEAAANEWDRLPAQVKAADDLQSVIDLYKKYLERFPSARQADDAKTAIATYQAMLPKDPVKFRGRWIPRAQVGILLKQWSDAARPALELYKAGRMKEALDALAPVLRDDNQNPDALALAGLAAFRTSNLPGARTHFAALAAADPGSLLAENNLAVVSTGQKQPGEALAHYTRALQIMPDHRVLLDNVAEALYAYTAGGGDKTGAAYRALVKAWEPAEARMVDAMAKLGQQRWGATWVSREQKLRLVKAQDSLRDLMNSLDAQYTTIRSTLATIESQIHQANADIDNDMSTINSCRARLMGSPAITVDTSFYGAQLDVATQNLDRTSRYKLQLQTQYDQLVVGTRDYLAQAEKLKTAFAAGGLSGQYSGMQRLIELGEVENPPAPLPVAEPAVPSLQTPAIIVSPPPAPTPPVMVPIPSNGQVYTPPLIPTPRGR